MDRKRTALEILRIAKGLLAYSKEDEIANWLRDFVQAQRRPVAEKKLLDTAKRFRFDPRDTKKVLKQLIDNDFIVKKGQKYEWNPDLPRA